MASLVFCSAGIFDSLDLERSGSSSSDIYRKLLGFAAWYFVLLNELWRCTLN
jgi:hypothetical protein